MRRMRRGAWIAVATLALAACERPVGDDGSRPASLPRPNGVWSAREALEGPMAVYGPPTAAEGVLTVTCLPRPRRTLVVTLLALPKGAAESGDLVLRAGRRTFHAPLAVKDDAEVEARIPADDGMIAGIDSAKDLRVEVPAAPKAGIDTGRPDAALKRVLAVCR